MALAARVIPTRFLLMVAHFVLVVLIFESRKDNVIAALPISYTPSEYSAIDNQMVVALSLTIGCFAIELGSFLGGVSMFMSSVNLLYIFAHGSAAITLAVYIVDAWNANIYWFVFGFCRYVFHVFVSASPY
eukprot:Colp12_sorted_trinity150504_noHs@3949